MATKTSLPFPWFKGILWSFPLFQYVLCNFSSSLLLFRSKLTDSCWGHSPRESLWNVCDCTQERNYEVNTFFLSGALDFINHVCVERELYNRHNEPRTLCLECPASGMPLSPKMYKCECLLLFIFEAAGTFEDLENGQQTRDLFPSRLVAILAVKMAINMIQRDTTHRLIGETRG